MIYLWSLLAALCAIPVALVFGKYILNLNKGNAFRAAMYDFLIIIMGSATTLTIWANQQNDIRILFGSAIGSSFGTYLVCKFEKKEGNE